MSIGFGFSDIDIINIEPSTIWEMVNAYVNPIKKNKWKVLYCNNDSAFNQYMKNNKFDVSTNCKLIELSNITEVAKNINTVANQFNETNNNDNIIILVKDEMIFNLLYILKLIRETSIFFVDPKIQIADEQSMLHSIRHWADTTVSDYKSMVQERSNILENDLKKLYSKFLKFMFINNCVVMNDLVSYNDNIATETNPNIPISYLELLVEHRSYPKINLDDDSNKNIDTFRNTINDIFSNLNTTLNNLLKLIVYMGDVNFITVNESLPSHMKDISYRGFENSNLINAYYEKYKNSAAISNEKRDTVDISDLYYILKYSNLSESVDIVVEEYSVKPYINRRQLINSLSFPNGIHRDKAAVNIYNNLMLRLLAVDHNGEYCGSTPIVRDPR